jgi:hypothetical protein
MSQGINYSKKLHILNKTIQDLGLSRNDYLLDNPKGIYFGFCHPQAQDFLCENINNIDNYDLKKSNEIFEEWLNRWAENRYNHLIEINNLKEDIKIIVEKKEIDYKKIYEEKKDYFKNYYNEKKEEIKKNKIIPSDKIIMPSNFSLYEEKGNFYIKFSKTIKGEPSKSAKKTVKSNNLQNELNDLIEIIKNKYEGIEIIDKNIINSQLFKLKSLIV